MVETYHHDLLCADMSITGRKDFPDQICLSTYLGFGVFCFLVVFLGGGWERGGTGFACFFVFFLFFLPLDSHSAMQKGILPIGQKKGFSSFCFLIHLIIHFTLFAWDPNDSSYEF